MVADIHFCDQNGEAQIFNGMEKPFEARARYIRLRKDMRLNSQTMDRNTSLDEPGQQGEHGLPLLLGQGVSGSSRSSL